MSLDKSVLIIDVKLYFTSTGLYLFDFYIVYQIKQIDMIIL